MTNLALYEIASVYREALDKLSDMDLPVEAIKDTLEGLQGDLKVKATNIVLYSKNLRALAEQIKLAEKKLSHRRKIIENKADSIDDYVKSCLQESEITKIECAETSFGIRKNPPSVVVTDESKIPDECFRDPPPPPPREPDKKLIAEFLKAGVNVEWAYLDQGTRLDIE